MSIRSGYIKQVREALDLGKGFKIYAEVGRDKLKVKVIGKRPTPLHHRNLRRIQHVADVVVHDAYRRVDVSVYFKLPPDEHALLVAERAANVDKWEANPKNVREYGIRPGSPWG